MCPDEADEETAMLPSLRLVIMDDDIATSIGSII
jgi:hypothetical protein